MKVLLILSDGMRPDAVKNHPVIQRLREQGTCCMGARTVMPSVTLPCHMSLFHSVDPERHGVTTNIYTPQVRPIAGIFERLAEAGKRCAMFYNWEELRDLGRPSALAYSYFVSGSRYGYDLACRRCTEAAAQVLKEDDIDFAFLYLGWPDEAGHQYGWMSNEYMTALDECCNLVGGLAEELGDEYAVIYTADHGGHGRTHGTEAPEDMTIPIFCWGKPFEPGKAVNGLSIKDIAPTIVSILGVEAPKEWEGKSIV